MEVTDGAFVAVPAGGGEQLPQTPVGPLWAKDLPAFLAIQRLAQEAGVRAEADPDARDGVISGSLPAGPLATSVEEIARAGGVKVAYRAGLLRIGRGDAYTVKVAARGGAGPEQAGEALTSELAKLGAMKVDHDASSATVSFTASPSAMERIEAHLASLRAAPAGR
jgi:hypothetical protein